MVLLRRVANSFPNSPSFSSVLITWLCCLVKFIWRSSVKLCNSVYSKVVDVGKLQISVLAYKKLDKVKSERGRCRRSGMAPKRLGRRAALKKSFFKTEAMAQAMMPATGPCTGGSHRGHSCPCAGGVRKPTLPSNQEIMDMDDESVTSMVLNNWTLWMKARKKYNYGPLPVNRIPPLFIYPQPVPLIEAETPKTRRLVTSTGEHYDNPNIVRFNKGDTGSSRGFKCVDYSIPTINYLGIGMRFWIIVKKSSNHKLEKYVSGMCSKPPRKGCLQSSNDFIMLSPDTLIQQRIDVVFEIQRQDKSIILFEGAYYAWINLVDNTSCLVSSLATVDWLNYAKRHEKYKCTCRETYRLDLKRMEQCYHQIVEDAKFGGSAEDVMLSAEEDAGLESDTEDEDETDLSTSTVELEDKQLDSDDGESEDKVEQLITALAAIPANFDLDEEMASKAMDALQKVKDIGTIPASLLGANPGLGLVNIAYITSASVKSLSDALKALKLAHEAADRHDEDDSDSSSSVEKYVPNDSDDAWEKVDPSEVFPHLRNGER